MELSSLTAVSPLDGRYAHTTAALRDYFSEFALIRARAHVEVEYLLALAEVLPQLSAVDETAKGQLRGLINGFSLTDAQRVKELERTTNHDVKALEYWLKEKVGQLYPTPPAWLEFIHFGLTSQDVNNTATPLLLRDAVRNVYLPALADVLERLMKLAGTWRHVPMLARTHGQPASPTVLGKELYVFVERLSVQRNLLLALPYPAKFGGATGNFNAHRVAYPQVDWPAFADRFVNDVLGLTRSQTTTQIEHYDGLAALFDNLRRLNVILIDLARDVWQYVSLGYFKQRLVAGEVGSSAMPHKVNPIDFENAEGNLGLANAIFDHLSNKLPVSRLQRDLTDSTVLRNIGVPMGHTLLALKSLAKGLDKLELNASALQADLDANWAVLAEAVQTVLRREGYPQPYEALKALTRTGEAVTRDTLHAFIHSLDVRAEVKQELLALRPETYTGTA